MDSSEYERKIASRFASFDQDGNGHISREDFHTAAAAVLREFGTAARSDCGQALYHGAEGFWQGMAGMADRDGDQRISREEFTHGAVKRLRDNPQSFAEIARPFLRAVMAVAAGVCSGGKGGTRGTGGGGTGRDSGNAGTVTVDQAERVLLALGVREDLRGTVAAALDKDGDGRITEKDAVSAFAAYYTTPEPE
ncbi:EF-hand domain-containing protein [Streptomyces xinghaiensis]|uniref:EF-hand domain-containing protein n=1 Tax=Streptomyces xinghaiensis TaxID=1038928 RepID=UPI0003197A85|nr:EF-hand domain-containing protein [Streptomyces xinghaiensis]MZE80889.1 EF-hand domain-containing protein [Streptomyces sp. SID5475]